MLRIDTMLERTKILREFYFVRSLGPGHLLAVQDSRVVL